MECDVFLFIIGLILDRADNLRSRCFSENQVHQILHLIGICLLEEERAADQDNFCFTKGAQDTQKMYEKLQKLVGSQRIESHKDLLNWTLATWQRGRSLKKIYRFSKNYTNIIF
jgi:hypothetical protein